MAYTKIKPIKSESHLKRAVEYITRDSKTEGKTNIFCNRCNVENAVLHFRNIRQKAMRKGNNVAHHICLSFSPEDNISADTALTIGQELMQEMYPDNQYVLAVHNDRSHIHCHILVNSVDMKNYKKINSNLHSLNKMRGISDSLCKKYGLSIINPEQKSHRETLKGKIDNAISQCDGFEEFITFMKNQGYEIKANKHLAFKGKNDQRFIRCESIGSAYTERKIRDRLVNKSDIKNKQKRIYDDKYIPNTNRQRLKRQIDNAIANSKTFEDFIILMQENYYIKQGKFLAFQPKYAKKYIRSKSIGEDYTEEMIKFRISCPDEYKKALEYRKHTQIYKQHLGEAAYHSRYEYIQSINNQIRTMNYLAENNIKCYADLFDKIDELEQTETTLTNTIKLNSVKISAIKDVKKSLSAQRQYKPVYEEYKNAADKDEYFYTHKKELNRYSVAETVLETADNKSIPDLNVELEKLEKLNLTLEERLVRLKSKLRNFENIKYNLECPEKAEKDRETHHRRAIYHNL